MSTQLFRKYIDIINENQQHQQLNEGMIDTIKGYLPKIMKLLGMTTIKEIAEKVKAATNGNYELTVDNALKVAKALGFDENMIKQPMAEGIAGNWQGKLLQILHLVGLFGGIASAAVHGSIGNPLVGIGLIAILVTHTFWSSDRGAVGAMGKHGNKGWETSKGPNTP